MKKDDHSREEEAKRKKHLCASLENRMADRYTKGSSTAF